MKKIYLLLAGLAAFAQTVSAQTERKLMRLEGTDGSSIVWRYDDAGRLAGEKSALAGEGGIERSSSSYTYMADKVVMSYVSGDYASADTRTSTLENGRIVADEVVLAPEEDGVHQVKAKYVYDYNAGGELVKMTETSNFTARVIEYRMKWKDGDIELIEQYNDGVKVRTISYTYDKTVSNKYVALLANPVLSINSFEGIQPYGQVLGGYFGKSFVHPVTSVSYAVIDKTYFGWTEEDNFMLSYIKGADGLVTKIIQKEKDSTLELSLVWEDVPAGISINRHQATGAERVYDLSGKRLETLRHGMNIIKGADGSVRKVAVR